LRRHAANALHESLGLAAIFPVCGQADRLARMLADLLDLVHFRAAGTLAALILRHVHGATADNCATASAGAKFRKSHFH
jgi:hypothetical protein